MVSEPIEALEAGVRWDDLTDVTRFADVSSQIVTIFQLVKIKYDKVVVQVGNKLFEHHDLTVT